MKKMNLLGACFAIGFMYLSVVSFKIPGETRVTISGIKSGNGKVIINVFKDNESYDKEQPFKKFVFDKTGLVNGSMNVSCPLAPGVYGLTMIDDENNNGKIDKNLIGIPKEGFGFSNFFLEKNKKPSFDDFKVDLRSASAKLEIKVKYM